MTARQPPAAARGVRSGGPRRSIARTLAAITVAVLATAAGSPGDAVGQLKLQKVGSFDQPIYVDSAPAFRGLLYVVEQPGRVSVVRNGQRLAQPLLDIRSRVSCCGERGLFSIAFDPNFGSNHLFYVYYTNNKGSIEIDEFRAPSGTRAVASSRRKVMLIAHPKWANHNGGQLQFGPDGYLYAGTGDGGGAGDSEDNARHLDVLLGKLLRINPHRQGTHPYTVPATNPFVGRAGRDEIYAYGLRNPWRFSFNTQANTLAIGDVGQGSQEEVDYLKVPAASGVNFGWPMWEGTFKLNPGRPDPNPNALPPVFPILTYTHSRGCAIVGGYVVHDPGLESLKGRYLYTDLCNGVIRRVVAKPSGATGDRTTGLHVNSPSSFGEGAGGRIYVTSLNGPVYRLRQVP